VPLIGVAVFGAVTLLVWGAVSIARSMAGQPFLRNPMALIFSLINGSVPWPTWATVFLAGEALILLGLAVLLVRMLRRRRRGRTRVDHAARNLATARDLHPYTPAGVAESAARLRPGGAGDDPAGHGVLVGRIVPSGVPLRSSWEDTEVDIWGPRTGKTTSRAIPSIVNAPGAVIATSNKRDLHDSTRGVREDVGRVWVFDPQDIIGAEPQFWVNPLATVTGPTKARELVSHFVAAVSPADAKRDAYFDVEGEALLGYYFLAAARERQPITAAYMWATNSHEREPLNILKKHGYALIAHKLRMLMELPEKTRDGVYSSAVKLLACLEEPEVLRWVIPPSRPLPEFDPVAFLDTRDTLYLLSKEGEGSASPLVAALTNAVFDWGERLARTRRGARLDPPLLCVLDEAANVCRIRQLPNLYSHFGSRGMLVMTILQSWEQGVEAWGRTGMQKMWSSANVRVYGGGEADANFLGKLSQLIGEHDQIVYSHSRDHSGQTSRTASVRQQSIYTIADLEALPRGRAIVLASGVPATLVATVPWMAGPHADSIRRSITRYDPGHRAPAEPVVAQPWEGNTGGV
jgi:type IV secretory pathway TraG/TraD family ATPase VirD4